MRRRELPLGPSPPFLRRWYGGTRATRAFGGLRRERVQVHPVDTRVGIRADQLLGGARSGSERAIDSFIVVVADLAGGQVIATVDPSGLERSAAHASNVAIADIGA